jgi:2-dehydro-3-deoxyphosphogluconate aldolase/(4S)-4-hydroxy-2-oxoglutarate aldolase
MAEKTVLERIGEYRVVPVIAIEQVGAALPLADALLAGGLPLAEITFRTAAAAEVLAVLARERPELLLGAGTILTPENARRAVECGARFGVAPGANPAVITAAQEAGLPFMPGVLTPSEIETALALGCRDLKFFPAEAAGGVAMLKALTAPYAHTGVRFVPTGGVSRDNVASYLALPQVLAVGGTWLATREDLAAGRWDEIRDKCREVRALVQAAKS